jgi:hypothetical protein
MLITEMEGSADCGSFFLSILLGCDSLEGLSVQIGVYHVGPHSL